MRITFDTLSIFKSRSLSIKKYLLHGNRLVGVENQGREKQDHLKESINIDGW